jgi:predicted RecA/RadA family phage recombinase
MKNFIQAGAVLTLPAPAGGIKGGEVIIVNKIVGIANYDAAEGKDVETRCVGVFALPKAAGAIAIGVAVYWDAAAKKVTTTATGNTPLGIAAKAAGANDTTVDVLIGGPAAFES